MKEKPCIEIVLPTQGKRLDGLFFQINAILNQSYRNWILWVLVDGNDEAFAKIQLAVKESNDTRIKVVSVPETHRGKWGHGPIRFAVEHLLSCQWFLTTGDDDCIMPWALESFVNGINEKTKMVIGYCLPVTRTNRFLPHHVLGADVEKGKITGSCCMYLTSQVKEFGYDDTTYEADWVLVEKMIQFPHTFINELLFVMPQSFGGLSL